MLLDNIFKGRVPLAHIPIAHIHSHRPVLRVFPLDYQSENFIGAHPFQRYANDYALLRKKVLLTIWLLSRPVTFLAARDRFNIPTSSAHNIFKEIIGILADLMLIQYIQWPNRLQRYVYRCKYKIIIIKLLLKLLFAIS